MIKRYNHGCCEIQINGVCNIGVYKEEIPAAAIVVLKLKKRTDTLADAR